MYKTGDWIPLSDWQKLPSVSGLYIIKNLLNDREYVGMSNNVRSRVSNHLGGKGRVSYIHRALKLYGAHNFRTCLYLEAEVSMLADLEIILIEERKTLAPNGYNLTTGGEGVAGKPVTEETREKLRQANLGKVRSLASREKASRSLMGRKMSPEAVAKSTAAKIGVKRSPETVEKMRIASTGRRLSEEARRKVGLASLGHKLSPEAVEKIRVANTGKRHSEETRLKISEVQRGRKASEETKQRKRESARRIAHVWEKETLLWEEDSLCPKVFSSAGRLAEYLGTCLGNVSSWCLGKTKPLGRKIAVAYT